VQLLTDNLTDDSLSISRLALADGYRAQVEALPRVRYPVPRDSLAVLDRTEEIERILLWAHYQLGHRTEVLAYADRLLRTLARYSGLRERGSKLQDGFPWEEVATAALSLPHGRARFDSLISRAQAGAVISPSELAMLPPDGRLQAQRENDQMIAGRVRAADSLGHQAPSIPAHVWFNTPDSVYSPVARTRSLNDGTIWVVVPGGAHCHDQCGYLLSVLDRVQHRFPSGVSVLVVERTIGHVLTHIVGPTEEVAWLDSLWLRQMHVTVPIAVWAGAPEPGIFSGRVPGPSPLNNYPWPPPSSERPRHLEEGDSPARVVVVDKRGVVRGYLNLQTHRDEAALARAIEYLRDESAGAPSSPLPPELVPPAGS
jgi:hypothetical protein